MKGMMSEIPEVVLASAKILRAQMESELRRRLAAENAALFKHYEKYAEEYYDSFGR